MQLTYLDGEARSHIVREIKRLLQTKDVQLIEQPRKAAATLKIDNEQTRRSVLSVDADGDPLEYRVYYQVQFSLMHESITNGTVSNVLEVSRDYAFDSNQVLGANSEEQILRTEMQRELAYRIVEQLSVLVN